MVKTRRSKVKKEEMVMLLRSAGADEIAVNTAMNAWELGAEWEREECLEIVESYFDEPEVDNSVNIAKAILARGMK